MLVSLNAAASDRIRAARIIVADSFVSIMLDCN